MVCLLFVSFGVVALAVGEVHNRSLVQQIDADGRPHHVFLRRGTYEIYTDSGSELATVGPSLFAVRSGGRVVHLERTSLQVQLGDLGSQGSGIGGFAPNATFQASMTGGYNITGAEGVPPSPGLTIIVAPTGDHLLVWLLPGAALILAGALIFFIIIVLESWPASPGAGQNSPTPWAVPSSSLASEGSAD